jgi:Mg-chelatase subunit ChlD
MLANYDEDATNLVVVITDGENDTVDRPTISLEDLLTHVNEAPDDQPVRVVPVSFGAEADFEILQRIADATGGQAYYSERGFDLVELFRAAVFGNVE